MARPVRFELTTPCSGGMYSIHLSYGRAVLWRTASSKVFANRQLLFYLASLLHASRIPTAYLLAFQPKEPRYPMARDRIPFASFSISSAFFTITTDRTCTESVFSTS